ncbi:MAG TPA: Nif3-like dinuclear metal center hexameric protein [Clostridiales bacterium]|nr:Nif3-like dinuclear metal center hexameric protein [Clostridiales bacterium]
MTVRDALSALSSLAPTHLAMEQDNVGLLVGDPSAKIDRILVSLDVTMAVLEEAFAKKAQLVVSHHPMPRYPLNKITPETLDGKKVFYAITHGISVISMHTNLDSAEGGVNDVLAAKLGLCNIGEFPNNSPGIGRIGYTEKPMALAEFVKRTALALGTDQIRFVDGGKKVHRVAIGSGNCSDLWQDALQQECDTFVSADFKYGQLSSAVEQGLNIVDGGHFPTENLICPTIQDTLAKALPEAEVLLSETHKDCIQFYRDVK